MKSILITASIIVANLSCFAQTYQQGKGLKKYEGEWIGVHNNDTFRIILKYKEQYKLANNLYVDAILGCYSYSENGIVTSSTMQHAPNIGMEYIFMSSNAKGETSLSFNEAGRKNGKAIVSFTLMPGTTNKAMWRTERYITQENKVITIKSKDGVQLKYEDAVNKYPLSKITAVSEWVMTKVN